MSAVIDFEDQPLRFNLGCGARVVQGWVNVDYALGARLAKVPGFKVINARAKFFDMSWDPRIRLHDLTKPFPWGDGVASAVYSSHTLEHMSREDGVAFVRQCRRLLREGGILRIIVPDLRAVVDRYVRGELAADHVVEALGVLYEHSGRGLKSKLAPLLQYPHKCMYDHAALIALLAREGFEAEPRRAFESGICDIAEVEIQGRTLDAVIVEGVKR